MSKTKNVLVGVGIVILGFLAAVTLLTRPAQAASLTSAQTQAIIGLLQSFGADSSTVASVNAALTGIATPAAPVLKFGSTGPSVTALQKELIAGGYDIPAITKSGVAYGYYGAQTAAAVAARAAVTPVTPVTPNSTVPGCTPGALFSSTTGASCTQVTTSTSALTGSGRLIYRGALGDTFSDLRNGDSVTRVIGASFDATGGDVAIQRVDATFNLNGNGGSSNLDRYVSDVSLYLNGVKLASMSPTLGDKSSNVWTIRFSGLNGVIKNGTTGNLYVEVTPVTNISSGEAGKAVFVGLPSNSVRAVGADGISDTYVNGFTQEFTVSSATSGHLTVSAASSNPVAGLITVASSSVSNVKILAFTLKAKDQNLTITDLAVSLGTSDNLSDVVSNVKLVKNGSTVSSKSAGSGSYNVVTFTNIGQNIARDTTSEYSIVVDFKGDALYPDLTTIAASTTVSGWDVSDSTGATVPVLTAAVGNTQTITATGISVAKGTSSVSTTVGLATTGDTTQYTLPFTITAGDNDLFIGNDIAYATSSNTTVFGAKNLSAAGSITGDLVGPYFKVLANTSRDFAFNVSLTATATGFTSVTLTGIPYGTTSTLDKTLYPNSFTTQAVYMQVR